MVSGTGGRTEDLPLKLTPIPYPNKGKRPTRIQSDVVRLLAVEAFLPQATPRLEGCAAERLLWTVLAFMGRRIFGSLAQIGGKPQQGRPFSIPLVAVSGHQQRLRRSDVLARIETRLGFAGQAWNQADEVVNCAVSGEPATHDWGPEFLLSMSMYYVRWWVTFHCFSSTKPPSKAGISGRDYAI